MSVFDVERRSLEQALADLVAKRDTIPSGHPGRVQLARMIRDLEAEIAERRRSRGPN